MLRMCGIRTDRTLARGPAGLSKWHSRYSAAPGRFNRLYYARYAMWKWKRCPNGTQTLLLSTLQDVKRVQEQADNEYKQTQDPAKKKAIEEDVRTVTTVVEKCKSNAEALKDIFEKVIPGDKASRRERYVKPARTAVPGKKNRVEDLMRDILIKLQALHVRYFFKQAADTRERKSAHLDEAVRKLSELERREHDVLGGASSSAACSEISIIQYPPARL